MIKWIRGIPHRLISLNEVRPRRPEQFVLSDGERVEIYVSMKSGLEGRNNQATREGVEHATCRSQ